MPRSVRLGDPIMHGSPTGTVIGPCSPDVFVNAKPKARQGDAVFCVIHYYVSPNVIIGASTDVITNSKGAARIGDPTTCGATCGPAASPDVEIDGGG